MSENEKDIITNENLKSKLLGRRCHAMKIRTGGRPALFTVTRGLVKQSRVTLASIRRARAECGVSGRTAEKFVSIAIRKDLGVNSIEPGLHVEMGKMNHVFHNHFTAETVDLEAKVESEASKLKRIKQIQQDLDAVEPTQDADVNQKGGEEKEKEDEEDEEGEGGGKGGGARQGRGGGDGGRDGGESGGGRGGGDGGGDGGGRGGKGGGGRSSKAGSEKGGQEGGEENVARKKKKRGRPSKSLSTKSKRKNAKKEKVTRKIIKKVPLVYCTSVNKFLAKVQELRQLPTLENT